MLAQLVKRWLWLEDISLALQVNRALWRKTNNEIRVFGYNPETQQTGSTRVLIMTALLSSRYDLRQTINELEPQFPQLLKEL